MSSIEVLLVEDDVDLREGMQEFLEIKGLKVTAVGSGLECYRELSYKEFAVAIIDLGLPDIAGDELVAHMRDATNAGVIVLTASSCLENRVSSYEKGADIFMSKPVEVMELLAAIQSLSQRRDEAPKVTTKLIKPSWKLDKRKKVLMSPDEVSITFTAKEFSLLLRLSQSDEQFASREYLCKSLFSSEQESAMVSLATLVKRVRQRIEKAGVQESIIRTDHGLGFGLSVNIDII